MTKRFVLTALVCALLPSGAHGASMNEGNAPGTPLAMVGTRPITLTDLDTHHPTALFQARTAFYEAEKKALEDYIEEVLLQEQANREKLSVEELLKVHVISKVAPDPDKESLRLYFEGLDTAEPFDVVAPKIAQHLRERRIAKIRGEYMQKLRADMPVVLKIEAPRTAISLDDTPVRGDANAPLMLVEYADYECPYCQQFQPELDKLEAEYRGRVKFAFKDVPLPNHSHAQKAAEATHCAGVQNKYWEFHDLLFSTKEIDVDQLKAGARKLALNTDAFNSCLDSGQQAPIVKSQFDEAQKLGLQGTPSFFLNGRFFSGSMSYEQLRQIIDTELASATSKKPGERAAR
ncbi:MAG: DsbA family protein [Terriglobia bacterium]